MVTAANQAAQAGPAAAFGGLGIRPVQQAAPPGPLFGPPPAVPGQQPVDPNAPIGMAQPSFLTPYQQPQLEPGSGAEMMFNDPELDNNILAQVYREVYGTDLPGWPPMQQPMVAK